LKDLLCGFGQGYLLAEPMPAASLEKTFAKTRLAARARRHPSLQRRPRRMASGSGEIV
jgi:hypothetical protein